MNNTLGAALTTHRRRARIHHMHFLHRAIAGTSGVARTLPMLGHSKGTYHAFIRTSVRSAEVFRGVWRNPPPENYNLPGWFRGRTVAQCKSLMANTRTMSVWDS